MRRISGGRWRRDGLERDELLRESVLRRRSDCSLRHQCGSCRRQSGSLELVVRHDLRLNLRFEEIGCSVDIAREVSL